MTSSSASVRHNGGMGEMDYTKLSGEGKARCKKAASEELWLKYYNNTLRKQGLITESEYRKMSLKISDRTQMLLKSAKQVLRYEEGNACQHYSLLPENRKRSA